MTGIPIERITANDAERLRSLKEYLEQKIIGQAEAIERITRSLQRSRAGLKEDNHPIGVFLFVGQTGVGKTLLAKELSKQLFDSERSLIRIDMSEYSERHTVARLTGSPPGYVGYGEGGELTEAVRRHPYAVVLFDEIEKAHPDIFNIMLQILDEGVLTDSAGRKVDFRNTIIILTSNVGSRVASDTSMQVGFETRSKQNNGQSTPQEKYYKALEGVFTPEFLNRIDEVIPFNPLSLQEIERIAQIHIKALNERMQNLGYRIEVSLDAIRHIASLGYESRYGARALRRTIIKHIEEPLSALIVEGKLTQTECVVVEKNSSGITLKVA
jgi:ATP-dependent Clp protease ATP-binding subunit ClpC